MGHTLRHTWHIAIYMYVLNGKDDVFDLKAALKLLGLELQPQQFIERPTSCVY